MGITMKLHNFFLVCATLTIFVISMPRFHMTEAAGFSINLIHRDSLQSPSLYSSSASLQRSFNRAKNLVQDYNSAQLASTEILPDGGDYLMRFSLGTPHVETLAIADTGSDLTWIQCKPCHLCFRQKAPFFNPNRSSTYTPVSCSSNTCNVLPIRICDESKGICRYAVEYGDRSFSRGDVATETITLGSITGENVSIPNVVIGCGHMDQGTFGTGTSGVVGLGGGKVSLIRQMGSSIKGKFSYCLVPFFGAKRPKQSKMSFGDDAVVSGGGVVTTPIVAKTPSTFYYLKLEGMTVGKQRFDLVSSSSSSSSSSSDGDYDFAASQEGNIIIDSGTTLTFLPSELYDQVERAVRRQMNLRQIRDPENLLSLCYLSRRNAENVPEIIVHFKGADVKLKAINTFVRTSEKSMCLAFAPATSIAIYGNLAQIDFLVGYDLEEKTVSFKHTDCSKA